MTRSLQRTLLSVVKLFIFILTIAQHGRGTLVVTVSGPIRGQFVQEENISYHSYQGIPYAEPPVGNLRFKVRNLL